MSIDWSKVSELALEAFFQGIITAIAVVITYRLGQMQSDRQWKRELEKKREEWQKTVERDKKYRQLEAIYGVSDLLLKMNYSSDPEKIFQENPSALQRANALLAFDEDWKKFWDYLVNFKTFNEHFTECFTILSAKARILENDLKVKDDFFHELYPKSYK
jgi:hypothetical protein